MPYSVNNPPDKLKGLPAKKQRQWVHVFNKCFEDGGDDAKCHAMAWGVVKKASEAEPVEHNDKYTNDGCPACASDPCIARELQQIALDLQDVEPRIASVLFHQAELLR